MARQYKAFVYKNSSFEAVQYIHDQIYQDYIDKNKNVAKAKKIENFLNALKRMSRAASDNRLSNTGGSGVLDEATRQLYNNIVQNLNLTDIFDMVYTDNTGLKFEELITEVFNEISDDGTDNLFKSFSNAGKVKGTTIADYAIAIQQEIEPWPDLSLYPRDVAKELRTMIRDRSVAKLKESIDVQKSEPQQIKADVGVISDNGLYINMSYNNANIIEVVQAIQNSAFSLKSYSSNTVKFGHTNFYKVMGGISQGFGGVASTLKKAQTDLGLAKFIYYAGREVLDIRHATTSNASGKNTRHYRRTLISPKNRKLLQKHLYDFQIIYEITGRGLHVTRKQYLNIDGKEVNFIIYNDRRRKDGKIYVIPANRVIREFLENEHRKVPNVYTRSTNSEFGLSANILANLMKS